MEERRASQIVTRHKHGGSRRAFLKRALGTTGGLLLASTASASASAGQLAAAAQPANTLIVAKQQDVTGLDPHKVPAHVSWRIFELVYSTLVRFDGELAIQPELAESWNVSDDGRTLRFNLRQGVTFHNGQAFTSADVKFTFERILDEATGAIARSFFIDTEAIETPDQNTVIFHLRNPNAAFLSNLANPNASVVSQAVVSQGDPAKQENMIGTGPYRLGEWVPNSYMVLTRHPGFYIKGQPVIDTIRFNIIPTEDAILAAMRTGNADFAIIEDPTVAKLARNEPEIEFLATPSLRYNLLFVNTAREPFDDVRVRRALGLAIDRQAVINGAVLGEGVVTGPFPPSLTPWALPVDQLFGYTPDSERAKQLLTDAGHPDGFSFAMMTQTTEPAYAPAIAQVVQAQLKNINVNMEIERLEFGQWVERWREADFDMAPGLNSGSTDPDYFYYRYFHSGESLNFVTSYSDPEVDRLLETGRQSTDPATRLRAYQELQTKLAEDLPFIWLFVGFEYRLLQPYVRNFTPMPTGAITYLRETTIERPA